MVGTSLINFSIVNVGNHHAIPVAIARDTVPIGTRIGGRDRVYVQAMLEKFTQMKKWKQCVPKFLLRDIEGSLP